MKKFCVIGNPIDHSLSPKLHNFWFKKNRIEAIYEKKFNIIKKNIYLKELNQFDEILLVGSGKGVVSTSYIVDSNWKRRKSKIFNSMYKTFEKEFKKEKYIYN